MTVEFPFLTLIPPGKPIYDGPAGSGSSEGDTRSVSTQHGEVQARVVGTCDSITFKRRTFSGYIIEVPSGALRDWQQDPDMPIRRCYYYTLDKLQPLDIPASS